MTESDEEPATILDRLEAMLKDGRITRAQVFKRLRKISESSGGDDGVVEERPEIGSYSTFLRLTLVGVLLVIAGALWWQWTALSSLAKVVSTLGTGFVLFTAAWISDVLTDRENFTRWLYAASGLALPVGLVTAYHVYGFDLRSPFVTAQVTGILFLFYLSFHIVKGRPILLFFTVVFGSGFFVGLTDLIGSFLVEELSATAYHYRVFVLSIIWLGLGFSIRSEKTPRLSSFFYGLGSLGLLASALLLGRGSGTVHSYWEIVFPFLVMFVLWLGVVINNRFCLMTGSLLLLVFLTKVSFKYFRVEVGLPMALILLGFGTLSIASVTYLLYARLKPAN